MFLLTKAKPLEYFGVFPLLIIPILVSFDVKKLLRRLRRIVRILVELTQVS